MEIYPSRELHLPLSTLFKLYRGCQFYWGRNRSFKTSH